MTMEDIQKAFDCLNERAATTATWYTTVERANEVFEANRRCFVIRRALARGPRLTMRNRIPRLPYGRLLDAGTMTLNEARRLYDLPPLAGRHYASRASVTEVLDRFMQSTGWPHA